MDLNHEQSVLYSDHYDVIVVGARAAGAATAMLLARHGLRTLLVDQSAFGSDTLSTHALMRGGVLQLSRWGLLDSIVDAGTPPVRRTTFNYAGTQVVISVKASHGVDALYAPRRTLLDPVIVRAAIAAGADFHDHTAVVGLMLDAGRTVGVRAVTSDARPVELTAPLVIGADGIRSTIARDVGATNTRTGLHGSAVTYGYWSDLDTDGYEWNFRANACSGVIPTNDGRACVFVSAPSERIGRGGVAVVTGLIAESSPELASRLSRATAPLGTRTWAARPGFIRRSRGAGWALVGDAGYYKDPISAHGLTDALRDAELLARAVAEGFEPGSQLDDALDDYERTRDRISTPLFDIVDRIASHAWDDAEIGDLLIRLSSAMADEVDAIATFDEEFAS